MILLFDSRDFFALSPKFLDTVGDNTEIEKIQSE
jgi:hypothetical protein